MGDQCQCVCDGSSACSKSRSFPRTAMSAAPKVVIIGGYSAHHDLLRYLAILDQAAARRAVLTNDGGVLHVLLRFCTGNITYRALVMSFAGHHGLGDTDGPIIAMTPFPFFVHVAGVVLPAVLRDKMVPRPPCCGVRGAGGAFGRPRQPGDRGDVQA